MGDITFEVMGLRREMKKDHEGLRYIRFLNKTSAGIGLEACNKILYGFCGLTKIATFTVSAAIEFRLRLDT